jgi:hypothetical protein
MKVIPLKSETTQDCPLSPYLFKIVLGVIARAVRQLKKIKERQFGKGEVLVYTDDVVVHISDPQIFYQRAPTDD